MTNIFCHSQIQCDTLKKRKLFYITFEIQAKDMYPVRMSGIFNNFQTSNFSTENAEQFIKTFYHFGNYTPLADKGYFEMINNCLESAKTKKYLSSKNKHIIFMFADVENKIWKKEKINLKTGENISLYIVEISGTFFKINKNNKGIYTSSLEWDIADINEIETALIPFDNLKLKKRN